MRGYLLSRGSSHRIKRSVKAMSVVFSTSSDSSGLAARTRLHPAKDASAEEQGVVFCASWQLKRAVSAR